MSVDTKIDPAIVAAWLAARSIARGLPSPVADSGGLRVDSDQPDERIRYLFTAPLEGLRLLGRTIETPFVALKLCATGPELLALLPERWKLTDENCMMIWDRPEHTASVPLGYVLNVVAEGPVITARIVDETGGVAASGHAVAHDGVFIYDRIRTHEAHRRRGLGTALIHALAAMAPPTARHVLTATAEGRALYVNMGWRDYCPYSTAMIPPA